MSSLSLQHPPQYHQQQKRSGSLRTVLKRTWNKVSSSWNMEEEQQTHDDDVERSSRNYNSSSNSRRHNNHRSRDLSPQRQDTDDDNDRYQNMSNNKNDNADAVEEEIYIVRQQYGIAAIAFSVVQTAVLVAMMVSCGGIAPLTLNPMVGPYPDALSEWGGKNAYFILVENEYYRLLTPIFLHAGVLHLLGNIAVQLESGIFFEQEWGTFRWLLIYIGSAIGSTALSVIAMPQAVSVGSSGAVMGLFGGKLAEVLLKCCERRSTQQEEIRYQVRNEQCCLVSSSVILVLAFSFIPFVDWAAHLGGVVSGFLIGLVIFAVEIQSHWCLRVFWLIAGTILCLVYHLGVFTYMYDTENNNIQVIDELQDVCGYYQQNFEEYECNCMRDEYFQNNNNNN